jgi:hypothetical protein
MEMADPMGDRNRRQRAQRTVRLDLLRCSQNIGHFSPKPLVYGPARSVLKGTSKVVWKIVAGGYLSMNTGAWLPRRRVQVGCECGNKFRDKAGLRGDDPT